MNILIHKKGYFFTFKIIISGFLSAVIIGSLLLMLPVSTQNHTGASFLDALFTSTSAVCVTGLVIYDTGTYWSFFGQLVILLLIQAGGMGVVTIAVSAAMISGRKIGLMQRSVLKESISAPHIGGIVRLTGFIIKTTVLIELFGTLSMSFIFCKDFGFLTGIWYSLFHSVSAFCNAGVDLMGIREPFSSLTSYSSNMCLNTIIIALIITGGIGFLTWEDIRNKKLNIKKYRMQSKVILTMSVVLIILPAVYFYFGEFSNETWNSRIYNALFQSVTARTAGFNTVDLTLFSESGKTILIILMLIGASPGSTGGGMKTTTAAVLLLSALSVFRRNKSTHCFGRRIDDEIVSYASATLMIYLVLFLFGGIIISSIEGLPILTCLFEAASAIGTVGLSLGITSSLGLTSKIILILLMFMGRVGGLTLIFAANSGSGSNISILPKEQITVG